MEVGAVGSLRHCKEAVRTARRVLDNTRHSLLVGLQASQFAMEMGLPLDNLTTDDSHRVWEQWRKGKCQPNFWRGVKPDAADSCGPYRPGAATDESRHRGSWASGANHDTISIVAIDASGRIAAGSSSNGANHKIPGRVGDGSIAGGGAYAESGIGGCASTGDGDIHLRFLPCFQVVEGMRRGESPSKATEKAVRRILRFYPSYVGALLAVDAHGSHAAAAAGWTFQYSVMDSSSNKVQIFDVASLKIESSPYKK